MHWFKHAIDKEESLAKRDADPKKTREPQTFYYDDVTEDACSVTFVAFANRKSNSKGTERENSTLPPGKLELASALICTILRPLKNPPDPLAAAKEKETLASWGNSSVNLPEFPKVGKFPSISPGTKGFARDVRQRERFLRNQRFHQGEVQRKRIVYRLAFFRHIVRLRQPGGLPRHRRGFSLRERRRQIDSFEQIPNEQLLQREQI